MKRRSFLALLGAALASPVLPHVTTPVGRTTTQGLAFHPDAFELAMDPLRTFAGMSSTEIADALTEKYMRPAMEHYFDRVDAALEADFRARGLL